MCFVRVNKLTSELNTFHPHLSLMNPDADDLSRDWLDRNNFAEINARIQQESKGSSKAMDTTVREIMYRFAHNARSHLSARPFCLFLVGLLTLQSGFSVAIYNYDEVAVSPRLNMLKDTEALIRFIRALTSNLTSVELGQYPTVTEIRDHEIKRELGLQQKSAPSSLLSLS